MVRRIRILVLLSAFGLTACASAKEDPHDAGNGNDSDAVFQVGTRLTGIVQGPGRAFPVQGALVAAYLEPPPAIPDHVYCEPCVELPPDVPNTITEDDGSFDLGVSPGQTYYITVQKGQFRRTREYTAPTTDGYHPLPEGLTTLPSRNLLQEGDRIPNIAVASGSYDAMEAIFGKVGMGEVDGVHQFVCDSAEGVFDIYSNGGRCPGPDFDTLLRDLVAMLRYHIIFVPCAEANPALADPAVQQNIRDYVWAGGKWYVADWSYDMVEQVWPGFLEFSNGYGSCDQSTVGDCNHGPSFNSDGHAADAELGGWLEAQSISAEDLVLLENWDTIAAVGEAKVGEHPEYGDLLAPPHVWVEGPWEPGASWESADNYPLTVSWPYNCGRVLFTTYHTVGEMGGSHPDLLPQELILFYLVMEIGVCSSGPIVR